MILKVLLNLKQPKPASRFVMFIMKLAILRKLTENGFILSVSLKLQLLYAKAKKLVAMNLVHVVPAKNISSAVDVISNG